MQKTVSWLIALVLALATLVAARAANTIYLPIIIKQQPTPTFTPTSTPTRTPTPTSTPTRTPTPTPTPTHTPTLPPATTGNIAILDIHEDGSGVPQADEYVVIQNQDTISIQVHNWTLRDSANHVFTFPAYVMVPGMTCRIYTNENHPEWCGFNYGSGSPIWNNDHDCATLQNSIGTQIDQFCY